MQIDQLSTPATHCRRDGSMTRIVITGGLGFIGHHLAKHYLDKNYQVTIVDNLFHHSDNAKLTKYRIEYLQASCENCVYLNHDCCEERSLWERIKDTKPKAIIHLASYANQAAVNKDPSGACRSMPGNSYSIANLAAKLNCQLIHVSSSMVYGNFNNVAMSEDVELKPTNLYGLLKKQTEEIISAVHPAHVIVRPSAVYGAGDDASRVVPKWILAALQGKDINVYNASSLLDFTHVNDLINGIARAEDQGWNGAVFNITRGQARSLGETALLIKQLTNSASEIVYHDVTVDTSPTRGALDITRAREHLLYTPRMNFESGLAEYVLWMKQNLHLYDIN